MSEGTDRKTARGQTKFQKEEGGRKYFVEAADRCRKRQTEEQGGRNFKKRTEAENILSKPPTDVGRDRRKNERNIKKRTEAENILSRSCRQMARENRKGGRRTEGWMEDGRRTETEDRQTD